MIGTCEYCGHTGPDVRPFMAPVGVETKGGYRWACASISECVDRAARALTARARNENRIAQADGAEPDMDHF